MKRGWNVGWKIGLVVGLLFLGLQWVADTNASRLPTAAEVLLQIGPFLAGAAAIAIVFGVGGALVGWLWTALFGRKPESAPPSQ
jgi:hypothetical protein